MMVAPSWESGRPGGRTSSLDARPFYSAALLPNTERGAGGHQHASLPPCRALRLLLTLARLQVRVVAGVHHGLQQLVATQRGLQRTLLSRGGGLRFHPGPRRRPMAAVPVEPRRGAIAHQPAIGDHNEVPAVRLTPARHCIDGRAIRFPDAAADNAQVVALRHLAHPLVLLLLRVLRGHGRALQVWYAAGAGVKTASDRRALPNDYRY